MIILRALAADMWITVLVVIVRDAGSGTSTWPLGLPSDCGGSCSVRTQRLPSGNTKQDERRPLVRMYIHKHISVVNIWGGGG